MGLSRPVMVLLYLLPLRIYRLYTGKYKYLSVLMVTQIGEFKLKLIVKTE
jgi:hypothetical protein